MNSQGSFRPQGVIGVVVIVILIVASIMLGNLFFTKILGIDVAALPPFLKFLVHMSGALILVFIAKKVMKF